MAELDLKEIIAVSCIDPRGLFLESPESVSGPESQLSNCNPLVLKSLSFNMFLM